MALVEILESLRDAILATASPDGMKNIDSSLFECDLVAVDDRERIRVVSEAIKYRRYALGPSGPGAEISPVVRHNILVVDLDLSLADGAASESSAGFFDSNNVPPWPTWIAYSIDSSVGYGAAGRTALTAFVPARLRSIADQGIKANFERCVDWLENWRYPVAVPIELKELSSGR